MWKTLNQEPALPIQGRNLKPGIHYPDSSVTVRQLQFQAQFLCLYRFFVCNDLTSFLCVRAKQKASRTLFLAEKETELSKLKDFSLYKA